jgi:hypothetical protein
VSKNAVCQDIITQAVTNLIPFRFVLFDVWFASADTMVFIRLVATGENAVKDCFT